MGPCNQILVGGKTDKGVVLVLVLIQFTESHCHSDMSTVWSNHASFNMASLNMDQVGCSNMISIPCMRWKTRGLTNGMLVISRYNSTTGLFVFLCMRPVNQMYICKFCTQKIDIS